MAEGLIIFFVFLCIAVEGDIGKHIFIQKQANWTEAQAYCRRCHTDLSFINSQTDINKLRKDAGGTIHQGWIGLHRDPNNNTAWMWSGGGHTTYQNWADGQPNNFNGIQNTGVITTNGQWGDQADRDYFHFYCVDVTVVEEKMSWEDSCLWMTSVTLTEGTATEIILSLDYRAVTMKRIIVLILFCIAVEADIEKHIYIPKSLTWTEAQAYCQQYHTDLSSFNRQSDIEKLRNDTGGNIYHGWIGLHRDPNNNAAWMWSGGGHITYQNWAAGEPNNHLGRETNGYTNPDGTWNDASGSSPFNFYCLVTNNSQTY
uniref:C-type lectin domain-containing protein n=1 Tax=Acanthochromis polyacanthus TaxID=80966 RepID=A0A3Q1FXH0_9TELE